jgi:hypothetical protein
VLTYDWTKNGGRTRALPGFRTAFNALTRPGQSEALHCILKGVTIHPQKLDLEFFERQEFCSGSQNRKEWLPFVNAYRTLCIAPPSEIKAIFIETQNLGFQAA